MNFAAFAGLPWNCIKFVLERTKPIRVLKSIMVKLFASFGLLALCAFSFSACSKAGDSGEATLVVVEQHHGLTIPNQANYLDSIFVKFNTQDLPADPTHNYDKLYVGVAGDDHVNLVTLNAGKYYIYGTGYDTTRSVRVTGGMAVKIKYGDRKKATNITLAVTE